jgi:isopentenyldiphosphate isomerase
MSQKNQQLDNVDEQDQVIGQAPRSECHGNPALVHRVAHVLVFDRSDRLLLQKRSMTKDIQPGRWDTSVGGHLDPGESYLEAACREMREELGVEGVRNLPQSSETVGNVPYLPLRWRGAFAADEIDEVSSGAQKKSTPWEPGDR